MRLVTLELASGHDTNHPDGGEVSTGIGVSSQGNGTSVAVPAQLAPSKNRLYVISISPLYQERLVAMEHTDLRRVEAAEIEADYEQRQSRQVAVYWWGTVS